MTRYLAVARVTVGDPPGKQLRELQEGLDRVIWELHERGMSPDDIEDLCKTFLEYARDDERRAKEYEDGT
jgi:hypothetical protein